MNNIRIYLGKDTFQPPVKLVQFDKGFTLTFEVYNQDGTPHIFTNDEHIELDVRINNNILLASSNDEFSLNGNLAMWTLKRELTVNSGKGIFTFSVCNSKTNSKISCFLREIIIGNAALNEDSTSTEVLITVIEELKKQIENGELIIADLEGQSSTYQKKNDNELQTTSKEVIGAINELLIKVGAGVGIDERVGILENLTTTAKENVVSAINEVNLSNKENTDNISDLNESMLGLQTGYKIPVLNENPASPANGQMWILKSATGLVPVDCINTYSQSPVIHLGSLSCVNGVSQRKTYAGIILNENIRLYDLKIRLSTRNNTVHTVNNVITIQLCEVVNNIPSATIISSKVYPVNNSIGNDVSFDLVMDYSSDNISLSAGKEYCFVLSLINPIANSNSYYSVEGINGSNNSIFASSYFVDADSQYRWHREDEQDANIVIRKGV